MDPMTEAEWLDCDVPEPMVEFLGRRWRRDERRLRLFAVACCRRIWHLLGDERSRAAVEAAERFAGGSATVEELFSAYEEAREAAGDAHAASLAALRAEVRDPDFWWDNRSGLPYTAQASAAAAAPLWASEYDEDYGFGHRRGLGLDQGLAATALAHAAVPLSPAADTPANRERREAIIQAERAAQVALLRDIFGNPFRPATIDPSWMSPAVARLVEAIDAGGAFDLLPILGDALEEAGCGDTPLLEHCRSEAPHVRGCWAVDALLKREEPDDPDW